jgi:hypothetical protein
MSLFTRKLVFHIILPLAAGVAIYIFFRQNTWFHYHLLPPGFHPLVLPRTPLNDAFIFNVPDFCWAYSLASSLFYWGRIDRVRNRFFPVFVLLLIVTAESVQYFLSSRFTFDWMDLTAAILAFLLSFLLNGRHEIA